MVSTRYGKLAMGSTFAAAFVAAGMIGFYVVRPLLKDGAGTDNGQSPVKFVHALPGALGHGSQHPAAMVPGSNSPSRAVPDPVMADRSKKIPNKMVWATFANSKELQKEGVVAGLQFGQEIAIAKTKSGKLYALANKLPPTGQPATFAKVEGDTIIEPVSGSAFKLSTGKPVGKWCPTLIGQILLQRISPPEDVAVFKVREQGGKIQVQINQNAKAQFEQQYWRGILDAQGKVDGGYY